MYNLLYMPKNQYFCTGAQYNFFLLEVLYRNNFEDLTSILREIYWLLN